MKMNERKSFAEIQESIRANRAKRMRSQLRWERFASGVAVVWAVIMVLFALAMATGLVALIWYAIAYLKANS